MSPDLYTQHPCLGQSRSASLLSSKAVDSSKVTEKHPFLTLLRKSENMNRVGEEAGLEAALSAHPGSHSS